MDTILKDNNIDVELVKYIENEIFPLYERNEEGHGIGHIKTVIKRSLELAKKYDVNLDMVYTIASYHDLGHYIDRKTDLIYYMQLGVNLLWSIIFFVLKWRLFAFIWLVFLAILIVLMIKEFYNKNKIAGLLQIPYLLWIVFAGYLNIAVYLLNK